MGIFEFLWTLVIFCVAVLLLPLLILCFLYVRVFRWLWLYFLTNSYKADTSLEFIRDTSIRTLMDTRWNQGVFTFLVQIHGKCQPQLVRKSLMEIVGRQDKLGNLMFPRLQQLLVSVWGCYAWKKHPDYSIDQNFVVGSHMFRGWPLSESNLQEYISQIVAKYLPEGVPPWQIVLIPNVVGMQTEMYFLLLRIHHVLLTEEKKLRISDLLMIKPTQSPQFYQQCDDQNEGDPTTPLLDVFEAPKALPKLYNKLTEDFSNQWNEFVSIYDPLENIELLKQPFTLYQFFAVTLITVVAIIREYSKDFDSVNCNLRSRIRYFDTVIRREANRRHVSFKSFINSLIHTVNPKNVIIKYIYFLWQVLILVILKLPILAYYELFAIFEYIAVGYCSHSNTFISLIVSYFPLMFNAFREIIYVTTVVISAPKTLLNQFFFTKFYASPQTIKLCGRKVVSWTDKIDRKTIRNVSKHLNLTDTEVVISAIGVAITNFLESNNTPVPEQIPIIARSINKTYLYANNDDSKPKRHDIGGVVCLNLPLVQSSYILRDYLTRIHRGFEKAKLTQPSVYALTRLQTNHGILTKTLPSILIQVLFNYFSRVYTVAVTEMLAEIQDVKYKTTIWGSEIGNIIYWRPSQANICLSLSLSCYADSITLAVMSDALLAPSHVSFGKEFTQSINQLVEHVKIGKI